ncbi:MAG: hypothetical protein HOV87_20160, partial [Catenulispora sp.]|nr:hypothetical protein [Catenulispora sp.]
MSSASGSRSAHRSRRLAVLAAALATTCSVLVPAASGSASTVAPSGTSAPAAGSAAPQAPAAPGTPVNPHPGWA